MKTKYRFLFSGIAVIALTLSLFGNFLIRASFGAQLDSYALMLEKRSNLTAYAIQSAYTNYALQGIDLTDDRLFELARAQGDDIDLSRADGAARNFIWLSGQTLYAQSAVSLSKIHYTLRISSDITALYRQRAYLTDCYRIAYIAAIFATTAALLLLTGHITKPLETLRRASVALERGNLDARAQIRDKSEIGALAAAFNRMADALCAQLARQNRFIDALTHEIKTPLTAMIGHADAIRSGRLSMEEMLTAAQTILREGKRLDSLSGKMTEWILLEHDPPQMISLSAMMLLEDAAAAFASVGENCRVRISLDARDAIIQADRALMTSLISNLVRNALNAGATEVSLRCEPIDRYAVRLSVSDNGCGMGKEELTRVTEPFYRVDKARSRANGGVGLGLALCEKIAALHHGILRFESSPGCGTKVTLDMIGSIAKSDDL